MIEEIKERSKNRTPGEWVWKYHVEGLELLGRTSVISCDDAEIYVKEDDADFIAHAPTDIEWLIKRVEDLEKEKQIIENDRVEAWKLVFKLKEARDEKI